MRPHQGYMHEYSEFSHRESIVFLSPLHLPWVHNPTRVKQRKQNKMNQTKTKLQRAQIQILPPPPSKKNLPSQKPLSLLPTNHIASPPLPTIHHFQGKINQNKKEQTNKGKNFCVHYVFFCVYMCVLSAILVSAGHRLKCLRFMRDIPPARRRASNRRVGRQRVASCQLPVHGHGLLKVRPEQLLV